MALFVLAFLAGVFTIATPCIFPILPFILARADQPFRRGNLPMFLGLAFAFAAVASLASVAGAWAVQANSHGRTVALAAMILFGLTMLFPALASRVMAPFASAGSTLLARAGYRATTGGTTAGTSMLIGIATGLVWAPCAGPVLGLILTGAALRGPSVETYFLLLTYALGAVTSLAVGVRFGRRLLASFNRTARWTEGFRRVLGAAVVAGAMVIGLGFDTSVLNRLAPDSTGTIEERLIRALQNAGELGIGTANAATASPALSGPLAALLAAPQWLNARPQHPEDLRGKVVLVNFWTYSCINCLRALPHVRAWAEKYQDRGLVVIGVHTPEFAFEKDLANVQKATAALGVGWPVAIDNDFGIWRAFSNQAWPALYFIGADGTPRRQVLGEGNYEQSERLIQKLLSEAGSAPVATDIAAVDGQGAQAAPDERNLRSGEAYVGYRQAKNFASPGGFKEDVPNVYRAASSLSLNRWSLTGSWTVGGEYASLNTTPGSIAHRFHARDLHLVMGPSIAGQAVKFRVTIDGKPPGADHGSDIDADGWGSVREHRLYQLVRQAGPVAEHTFEIEFFDAGVRAYAFTFG